MTTLDDHEQLVLIVINRNEYYMLPVAQVMAMIYTLDFRDITSDEVVSARVYSLGVDLSGWDSTP